MFRVVSGQAVRTRLDIGQRREGRVEVLRGLSKDDVVVTDGQLKIRDGMPVRIADAAGAAPTAAAAAK